MQHRIFTTSQKAWAGMLAGITKAEKSIYLEMYFLEDDVAGNSFLAELQKAADRGLKVIVILDMRSSHRLYNSDAISNLRKAGAEILFFSFFLRRLHRKILIIDEKTTFIGGVNIKKDFASWRDLQIRVTGRVVPHIVSSFARTYKECGGKESSLIGKNKQSVFRRAKMWFLERGIGKKTESFKKHYIQRIDHAQSSITIVTPYMLPPRWFIAHLHQALLRGVIVEIMMPVATDHAFANSLNRSYASFLTRLGVRCYFSPGAMNHSKAMLIDGREGLIGSQNMDILSFDFNAEAGIFFNDPKIVKDLSKIIEKWKSGARLSGYGLENLYWFDVVFAFTLRLFGFLPLW